MAIVALCHGVRASQRKAIVVILDGLDVHRPSLHVVTLLAIRSELSAVNVSMAFGALTADVGEDHLGVALRTGNTLVHAAQRVAGLVVIEFRNGANRFPAADGVTVLTGDCQIAVRACCGLRRRALS